MDVAVNTTTPTTPQTPLSTFSRADTHKPRKKRGDFLARGLNRRRRVSRIRQEVTRVNLISAFLNDDRGADLIEYALLAGLIALAMTTVLGQTKAAIEGIFNNINTALGQVK